MTADPIRARTFIHANGRLLEQLLHACLFEAADPAAVVRAVLAYRNDDGGFGHGLEPDKRCPDSQPLDVELALGYLVAAGASAPDVVASACDYLTTVADGSGAVPVLLPSIAGYPRASHWEGTDRYEPGLNPTAAIAAHVLALGATHPWVDSAVEHCFAHLEQGGPPAEAHTLLCVARLLEQAQDRDGARSVATSVAAVVPESALFQLVPDPTTYGVTPLQFAPHPTSPARAWFDDAVIEAHLRHLEESQEADGGWPVRWQPPSEASALEWRAIRTLDALRVLTAYGRLPG